MSLTSRLESRTRTGLRIATSSLAMGLATVAATVLPVQVGAALPTTGTTFHVNSATDSGATDCTNPGNTDCGIDDSVTSFNGDATANHADTIVFSPTISTFTVGNPTAIDNTTAGVTLTIAGNGPTMTIVTGAGINRVFSVDGVNAVISELTIENGSSDFGAGIENEGTLSLINSTVSDNNATEGSCTNDCGPFGGGIENGGTLTVTNSTVSGNSASTPSCTNTCSTLGGAIESDGTLTMTNSTLSGNNATTGDCTGGCDAQGGGIYNGGLLTVTNSTISGNSASTPTCNTCTPAGGAIENLSSLSIGATIVADSGSGGTCDTSGAVTDLGYNLEDDAGASCGFSSIVHDIVGENPDLGSLLNNGGPTKTLALNTGSPAIDKVPSVDCPLTDQRGAPRTAPCDIGAYDTDFPALSAVCATGTPYYLYATYRNGVFTGEFCVNANGDGTYTQHSPGLPASQQTLTGTGHIRKSQGVTSIQAYLPVFKNLNLVGSTNGTVSSFGESGSGFPTLNGTFTL